MKTPKTYKFEAVVEEPLRLIEPAIYVIILHDHYLHVKYKWKVEVEDETLGIKKENIWDVETKLRRGDITNMTYLYNNDSDKWSIDIYIQASIQEKIFFIEQENGYKFYNEITNWWLGVADKDRADNDIPHERFAYDGC